LTVITDPEFSKANNSSIDVNEEESKREEEKIEDSWSPLGKIIN